MLVTVPFQVHASNYAAIKYYIIGDASPRPIEAYDCDMFCNNGPQGGKPGMPSTHMAVASAFSILYLPKPLSISITQPIAFYFLILVGAMASARYYKKCHTIEQIVAGTLFGISCGLVYRVLIGDIQ
jgi:membrane-associated phospholipid phosphatase